MKMRMNQHYDRARLWCAGLCAALALGVLHGCGGSDGDGDGSTSSASSSSSSAATFQGGYAYAVSTSSGTGSPAASIYPFSVGADGSLQPLSQAPVSIPGTAADIAAGPSGQYVYTINLDTAGNYQNNTISLFAVSDSGTLAPLATATVALPDLSCVAYAATVDPTGHFLYVVGQDAAHEGSVAQFAIESDGTLSPLNPAYISFPVPSVQAGPNHLVFDSSGQHAYLASANQVALFTVGSDGTLPAPAALTLAAVTNVAGFALAPDGQHAYVLSPDSISLYTVASTGELAAAGSLDTGGQEALQLLFDPAQATTAYVLSAPLMPPPTGSPHGANVSQYAVDSSGMLSASTGNSTDFFGFVPVEASVFGPSFYVLGLDVPPSADAAPVSPSGLGTYSIGPMGLTAGPVVDVPGIAAGMVFVAAH